MALTIKKEEKHPGVFVLHISGKIDSETYMDLEEVLEPILVSSTKAIVFDMANVSYISSMGLRTIFKARQVIEENGGMLIMVNLQPQIEKVLSILKAIPDMDIFENMAEADNYLSKLQRNGFKRR